jgi:class 3 adenylate cyclase
VAKRTHNATSKVDGGNIASRPCQAQEAESLLHIGEPLLAYNVIKQALSEQPGNIRLRQLRGLALARSGAVRRANEELASLRDEGFTDGETLGLLARTHKDLALAAADKESREQHLGAAFEIYAAGYSESRRCGAVADAYYTGINAATMSFLRDHIEQAHEIAADVEDLCQIAISESSEGAEAYWPQATLAEAALILGNERVARERYAVATTLAGNCYGDLSSTRHQARLLLEHQGASTAWLDDVMRMPPVLVYTGHMIDVPGRSQQRFSPQMESEVRARIRAKLQHLKPVAAYGSAACGADILCLECMLELGGELHIVLPFPADQFRTVSVDFPPDGHWGARFEHLLECANEVLVIGERPPPGGTSTFEYANLIMTGLARLRAQMLDTDLQGLAVWDGAGASGEGGTGSLVSMWQSSSVPLQHIELTAAPVHDIEASAAENTTDLPTIDERQWAFEYKIKAMLFADAVGYSRLSEDQIPLFIEHYVGTVAEFNKRFGCKALHIETAGDGMYMVFDDPGAAAHYALGLSELINSYDWQSLGLPDDMSARIGLHCGPVFIGIDPITDMPLYSGIHTNRTARIEPITPPGQVYASSAFAAVAAARGSEGLRFSYIGRTQLAKHYGALPLYHVKRSEPQALCSEARRVVEEKTHC